MNKKIITVGVITFYCTNALAATCPTTNEAGIISTTKSVDANTLYNCIISSVSTPTPLCYKDQNLYLYFCGCTIRGNTNYPNAFKTLPECDPNADGSAYKNTGCRLPITTSITSQNDSALSPSLAGCTINTNNNYVTFHGACLPKEPEAVTISPDNQNTECKNICNCSPLAPDTTSCTTQHSSVITTVATMEFRDKRPTICKINRLQVQSGSARCDSGYYATSKSDEGVLSCSSCPNSNYTKQSNGAIQHPSSLSTSVSSTPNSCYIPTGLYTDKNGDFELTSNCYYSN